MNDWQSVGSSAGGSGQVTGPAKNSCTFHEHSCTFHVWESKPWHLLVGPCACGLRHGNCMWLPNDTSEKSGSCRGDAPAWALPCPTGPWAEGGEESETQGSTGARAQGREEKGGAQGSLRSCTAVSLGSVFTLPLTSYALLAGGGPLKLLFSPLKLGTVTDLPQFL